MSLIADDVANSGRNIFAESPLLAANVLLARLKVHGCSAHSLEARHSIRTKKITTRIKTTGDGRAPRADAFARRGPTHTDTLLMGCCRGLHT